ncbi:MULTISPECIES: hypothetical protein [Weeksella]|uniref:hypothetical protein n=1 Tax=Weeksella TaxID=1013 RepID=UPI0008A3B0B1|nr:MULTISPECIES: hypothetical protein [Weeksella]MDK7375506.1 hypothetical protein [Weeksella virosa]OFM84293.1 hypothetical protein HMPREF2660_08855 [Weeksella sp. HMSC059D05]SUP54772.1 Uncharacterised protein [Weeksella virosa]
MQYTFSNRLKMASLIMLVVGVVLYAIGFFIFKGHMNNSEAYITELMHANPSHFYGDYISDQFLELNPDHQSHMEHLQNLLSNRPWAAFYVPAYYAFGIAATALFFLCVQFVGQAGWSMVVTRVMEGIASYLPIGSLILGIFVILSAMQMNHLFHWMVPELIDPNDPQYDIYIANKAKLWLNVPFWTIRCLIYLAVLSLFVYIIKGATRKLDEYKGDITYYNKLYTKAVLGIVCFALFSAAYAWDFVMSLDPHWYSSLFMWYGMVSHLVASVSVMAIISIYLKKKGALRLFNDNHQHDLAKFMFGFSLLWSYLWFCQFMLQWYSNVPEEVQYFQQRMAQYPLYFWMLLANLVLPFVIMVSSSIKRRSQVVFVVAILIVVGHYWDFYNQIMPAAVGPFHNFGFMEIGALVGFTGLFIFIVMNAISKLNLEATGHPYFHESKIYEYPF